MKEPHQIIHDWEESQLIEAVKVSLEHWQAGDIFWHPDGGKYKVIKFIEGDDHRLALEPFNHAEAFTR